MGGHGGDCRRAARGARRGREVTGLTAGAGRFVPLLEGGAAGSLGAADLEELGFELAAVNILELAVSPGLDVVAAAGGLGAFTGWQGALCAVVLGGEPGQPSRGGATRGDGWRARRLPVIEAEAGGRISVRSPIDGTLHNLDRAALDLQAVELGATAAADSAPGGELRWWRSLREPAPAGWVVSAVPADAAREGLYWSAASWQRIDATADAADDRPLDPGCPCRACRVARLGYIAHLWRQHEITASHLLGWHNLHQARRLVEGA